MTLREERTGLCVGKYSCSSQRPKEKLQIIIILLSLGPVGSYHCAEVVSPVKGREVQLSFYQSPPTHIWIM